jgi:hypothetical protein
MKTYVTPKAVIEMLELPDIMIPSAEATDFGAKIQVSKWTFKQ